MGLFEKGAFSRDVPEGGDIGGDSGKICGRALGLRGERGDDL